MDMLFCRFGEDTARDGGFYLLFLAVLDLNFACPVALSKGLFVQKWLRFLRLFRYRGYGKGPETVWRMK